MKKIEKIVQVKSFFNTVENNEVTKYAMDKFNDFLKTIKAEDYISHAIMKENKPYVQLTYRKVIK